MIYATFTEESLKEFLVGKVITDIHSYESLDNKFFILTFQDGKRLEMKLKLYDISHMGEEEDAKQA